ncbi:MAG TPA: MSMEG_1061 family FMN-dependent PPOX-type flavoprotein [Candidatus Binatia bacterium]|jgi:PPOX class probable FMN-dependent enzyme|nr:MSMEG_1061 family FMN-dependent PPOX-type flavoprotein [Candidatus Binatia bacterium]
MSTSDPHRLTTLEQVRAVVGEESPVTRTKIFPALDATAVDFIAHAPILLLATADADGRPEVSPKGDGPGFVLVDDERTLLIPDRKGNRLVFGLQNILANPTVALIFLVPGTEETLRVQGEAELTIDPAILQRLTARGQPALLAIRVRVMHAFFHCAKAFKRSTLWKPESWPANLRVSFGKMLAPKLGGGDALAATIDQMIDEDYKTNL